MIPLIQGTVIYPFPWQLLFEEVVVFQDTGKKYHTVHTSLELAGLGFVMSKPNDEYQIHFFLNFCKFPVTCMQAVLSTELICISIHMENYVQWNFIIAHNDLTSIPAIS